MMKPCFLLLIFRVMLTGQTTEGDVVNAVTGAPVAGAYVSYNATMSSEPLVAKTDVAGHFRLPAPVIANFPAVQVVHGGFLRGGAVLGKPGQADSTLRIELTPAAIISGKIEDEDGFQVEGAQVQAVRYRMVNGKRKLQPLAVTQTDDLGQYRLIKLPAGRYWVHVGSGSASNWDRRYVAEYFPGTLGPDDTGQVSVEAGQEHGGVDIRLAKYEGVSVTGRIEMPAGAGTSGRMLPIYLQRDPGDLLEVLYASQQPDGSFIIRHVPPGDYILRAASGGYPPKAGDLLGEQKLRVGGADERGIVLKPHEVQAVDLAGTVVMEGGGNPPPMFIGLRGVWGPRVSARSNEDGSFVLKDLLPGHYDMQIIPDMIVNGTIEPRPCGNASYPVSARLGENEVLQTGFDLDGPPGGPLRITLSSRWIEISGKLLDASGGPVSGALLAVTSDGSAGEDRAATGADGAFRVMLRQPGDYHIHLIGDGSDWDDPDYLKKHESDFPLLRVVDGTNPPVALRLPAPQAR
jgi:hypothetical protein